MKKLICGIVLLGLSFLMPACKKDVKPEESYIKIYDDQNGNKHFHPLSITTSADGEGFLVLSAYDGWKIHLMKVDKAGEFQWNYELPDNYVNAVPNLIQQNGQNYLICMDAVGLSTYVLQIDENNHSTTEIAHFTNILYPTYAYNSGQTVYFQNYDRSSYKTGIHRLSADLSTVEQSGSVNILTDVEDKIINHVTYIGKRIPFFVSSTPEQDYIVMNGFYNYSFSLIFLHPDLSFAGVYNGAGFDGGLSAISPSGNNRFSLARFSFDNLYYNAGASLTPTTIDIATSIPAQGHSELDAAKPVVIKDITVNGTLCKAFISSTRSNQVLLSLYERAAGTLIGKLYLGKNIPYTICDFIQTEDEGLNILVQVKIMGSFDRIALMKIPKERLTALVE